MGRDIDVVIDRGLRIRRDELNKRELAVLTARFKYPNPTRALLQRMGKFYKHLPPTIDHFELTDDELILPRGGGEKVEAWAAEVDRVPWWTDRRLELEPVRFDLGENAEPVELRDDQERLIAAFLERENVLIRAAPGGGKTELSLELIRRIGQPALVIVWSKGLLEQWVKRIEKRWGWSKSEIGVYGGGRKSVRPVTIAMQQTLYRPGIAESLADQFGFIVVDEVQRASSKTLREIVRAFPARYRLGVSADERRKDRLDVLITDNFGEVAAKVDREELIARGDLCEVEVIMVPSGASSELIDDAPNADKGLVLQQNYVRIISELIEQPGRLELVARIAALEIGRGEHVLIFTDRVAHARAISKRIVELGHRCGLMIGGPENREAFRESAEKIAAGKLKCAVGTSAVYQGIDIPRLTVGIVATPTASNAQLLEQQVGRLRRKFPGKQRGRLYYVWDDRVFPKHRDTITRIYGKRLVSIMEPG